MIASHSANPTAACLLTAYGAEPICVRRPAAEAVATKYPSPRSSPARQQQARGEDVSTHVDRKSCLPDLVGGFDRSRADGHPGIGEEHVNRTQLRLHAREQAAQLSLVGHVSRHGKVAIAQLIAQLIAELAQGFRRQVGDRHAGALGVAPARQGTTDAPAAPVITTVRALRFMSGQLVA